MPNFVSHLKLKQSKTGIGVFTDISIPSNSLVIEFGGDLLTSENIKDKKPSDYLQVGPNTFLSLSGKIDDWINHSCSPNCFLHIVGIRAFLYSRFVIPANTEITFDYSTSSTAAQDEWSMKCNCGSRNCRKMISGYQYLDEKLKEEYLKQGLVPLFLKMKIFV